MDRLGKAQESTWDLPNPEIETEEEYSSPDRFFIDMFKFFLPYFWRPFPPYPASISPISDDFKSQGIWRIRWFIVIIFSVCFFGFVAWSLALVLFTHSVVNNLIFFVVPSIWELIALPIINVLFHIEKDHVKDKKAKTLKHTLFTVKKVDWGLSAVVFVALVVLVVLAAMGILYLGGQ
jgi:hypothetical protein